MLPYLVWLLSKYKYKIKFLKKIKKKIQNKNYFIILKIKIKMLFNKIKIKL